MLILASFLTDLHNIKFLWYSYNNKINIKLTFSSFALNLVNYIIAGNVPDSFCLKVV